MNTTRRGFFGAVLGGLAATLLPRPIYAKLADRWHHRQLRHELTKAMALSIQEEIDREILADLRHFSDQTYGKAEVSIATTSFETYEATRHALIA